MVTNWATFVFFEKAICQKKKKKSNIKIGVSADFLSTKKGTRNF